MKQQNISLRDANQNFSRLIAAVERGETFCITRRGHEVARLLPSSPDSNPDARYRNSPSDKALPAGPLPAQGTTLDERLLRLEARVDKLSAAATAANHPSSASHQTPETEHHGRPAQDR
ncbi:MAG: type II toxin-antitoxin system prevent-host-death family antitoxin [Pseudomonadota bacterium]|uniref:type II toxin-antitoxin system Phd/YefM family antitoxin n=1 Tax=Polaromonas sp. TaxID=1869339 RepID=UPI0018438662|nr:type II toxin-antitoxin system prevent-host-death family antitoxin [Polaromonas sp.]MDQ3272381.1 type II toxin-antitoxin system prevent-host-death family antitoxin [Pseudomonadota bacterium]